MFAFWTQPTPGIRYLRADLPCSAYPGSVCLDFAIELMDMDKRGDKDLWKNHPKSTPGIWQLVSNRVRYQAMREQRLFAPVYLDIDDDYTEMHPAYNAKRWVEFDYETPDLTTSSIECHRWVAEFADGIIVTTPYLASKYRELNDKVYICRNSVDPTDWQEPLERDPDEFVIMFSGSPRPGDLIMLRRGLEWAAKQPGVKVYLGGGLNMGFKGVKTVPWTDFGGYFDSLTAMKPDITLRPVENSEFAKSKSDLKILEGAMAGAFPIVQAWEPYKEWIAKGDDYCLWAASPKDWEQRIKYAVNNRDEMRAKAVKLREHVIATRSIDVVKEDWQKVLDEMPEVEDTRFTESGYYTDAPVEVLNAA